MTINHQKVAIVTGASRGIGRAIAEKLAKNKITVVVNFMNNKENAEEVVSGIQQSGGHASAFQADVSKVEDIQKLFSYTIRTYEKVDILVNNAGIGIMKSVEDISEHDFDRIFELNVKGPFFAMKEASKLMSENGRIINLSTTLTKLMLPTYSAYVATKGAVDQMTRVFAKELGPKKITVNAVAPGPTETEFFTAGKTEEQIENFGKMPALGRLGQPGDIANIVAFLVTEESTWITGQTIYANGGLV